jgi:hypothetical protein
MTLSTLEKPEVTGDSVATKKPRRRLLSIVEFLLFLIIGLLLLEPVLKLAGVADEENYLLDDKIGWTPVPNRCATFRGEGYSRYKINSLGMRDKERTLAKPPNTFRIAVIGCSMTEGKQVPLENTYCSVLEKQLNKDGGAIKYEVLNFAVSAYTLGQEYLRLKNFALQFKPDLVVFTARPNALLYMGPDLDKGFFNARPVFGVMPDGTLVEDHNFQKHWTASADGKRVKNFTWLSTYSCLYGVVGKCAYSLAEYKKNFVAHIYLKFASKRQRQRMLASLSLPGVDVRDSMKTRSVALDYLGKVAAALVRESKNECDKAHCRFLLAYLPTQTRYMNANEQQIIHKFAEDMKIDLVDFNPEFEHLQSVSLTPLYIDIHPSKFGHEKIAAYLKTQLEKKGLLKLSNGANSVESNVSSNVN